MYMISLVVLGTYEIMDKKYVIHQSYRNALLTSKQICVKGDFCHSADIFKPITALLFL